MTEETINNQNNDIIDDIGNTGVGVNNNGTFPINRNNSNNPPPTSIYEFIKFYVDGAVKPSFDNLKNQLTRCLKDTREYKKDCADYTNKYSHLEGRFSTLEKVALAVVGTLVLGFAGVIGSVIVYFNTQITEIRKDLSSTREEFIKEQHSTNTEHTIEQEKSQAQATKPNPS